MSMIGDHCGVIGINTTSGINLGIGSHGYLLWPAIKNVIYIEYL